MKRKTNWQQFYEDQIKDKEFRHLLEQELRSLRVGVQLAQLRQRKKLSQAELAERTGMKAPNISRIENDPGHNLTIETMAKIAVALGHVPQIRFKPIAASVKS